MRDYSYRRFHLWYSCLLLALTLGWSSMLAAMSQAQLETVKLSDGRFYVLYIPNSLPGSAPSTAIDANEQIWQFFARQRVKSQ